jgi:hypothetical protein
VEGRADCLEQTAALVAQIAEVDSELRYVVGFLKELSKGLDKIDAIVEDLGEKIQQKVAARREALCAAVIEACQDHSESDVEFTDEQMEQLLAEVTEGQDSTPPWPDWLYPPEELERITLESRRILDTPEGQCSLTRAELAAALGFDEADFGDDDEEIVME